MKTRFDFRSSLALDGEILTQPATFLPGQLGHAPSAKENFSQKSLYLPDFGGFHRFNPAKNTMAQPLLKEHLQ
jgi:hypothetical protein